MKLSMKLIFATGVACIVIGVAGVAVVLKGTDINAGLTTIDIEKKVAVADIKRLSVDTDVAGVAFLPGGNSDEIKVHMLGTLSKAREKDLDLSAVSSNQTWTVNARTQKSFNFGFNVADIKSWFLVESEKKLRLEVTLPDKVYEEIRIKSSIGSIQLTEIQADRLTAQADTGKIALDSFNGKSLDLGTDTGAITVKQAQGNVRLKTDTGSIDATLQQLADTVDVQSNTGSVRLTFASAPTSATFSLSSDIGRVSLSVPGAVVDAKEKHNVKATIGAGAAKVRVQTDTGSIDVGTGK
jgi:hypothetical protein